MIPHSTPLLLVSTKAERDVEGFEGGFSWMGIDVLRHPAVWLGSHFSCSCYRKYERHPLLVPLQLDGAGREEGGRETRTEDGGGESMGMGEESRGGGWRIGRPTVGQAPLPSDAHLYPVPLFLHRHTKQPLLSVCSRDTSQFNPARRISLGIEQS